MARLAGFLSLVLFSTAASSENVPIYTSAPSATKTRSPVPADPVAARRLTLTILQKMALLNKHNDLRAAVTAPCTAADMEALTWDDTLASESQTYAAQCAWQHDPRNAAQGWGENLAITSDLQVDMKDLVEKWYNETVDVHWEAADTNVKSKTYMHPSRKCQSYDGDSNTCMIRHYTQVVWASTNKVGCGLVECSNGLMGHGGLYLVCKYNPPGNVQSGSGNVQRGSGTLAPYMVGKSCAACTTCSSTPGYQGKLCAVGDQPNRCSDTVTIIDDVASCTPPNVGQDHCSAPPSSDFPAARRDLRRLDRVTYRVHTRKGACDGDGCRRRRSRRRLTVDELATAGLEPQAGYVCAEQDKVCKCFGSKSWMQSGRVTYGKRYKDGKPGSGNETSWEDILTSSTDDIAFTFTTHQQFRCSDRGYPTDLSAAFHDPARGYTKRCFCQPCECSKQQDPKYGWGGHCDRFGGQHKRKWCYVRQDHCPDEKGERLDGIEKEEGPRRRRRRDGNGEGLGLWRSEEACDRYTGPSGGGTDRKDTNYKDVKNEEGCHAPNIGTRLECETCFHTDHCVGFEDGFICDPTIKKCLNPTTANACKGPIAHCDPPCDKCTSYNCTDGCQCDTKGGEADRCYKQEMDWITWANLFESLTSSKLIPRPCTDIGQVGEAIRGLTRIFPLVFFGVLIVVFAP